MMSSLKRGNPGKHHDPGMQGKPADDVKVPGEQRTHEVELPPDETVPAEQAEQTPLELMNIPAAQVAAIPK